MPSKAPKPAKPSREIFDAFNSSATGHQRAENRLGGSTAWRDSRTLKLQSQFKGGTGGGQRVSDTVGAGSLDFGRDGRTANGGWEKGASGLRKGGQKSILESRKEAKGVEYEERPAKRRKTERIATQEPTRTTNPFTPFRKENGTVRESSWTSHESSPSHLLSPLDPNATPLPPTQQEDDKPQQADLPPPKIFKDLVLYVNGSCGPDISDHRLKRLWHEHGGSTSISLARLKVTHVLIGRPSSRGGCGGGLAAGKIHKEVAKKGGANIKFVTAEWVTASISAGKRLPESRFAGLSLAPKGVGSVADCFGQGKGLPTSGTKPEGREAG